jgi:hypothetical protein
MGWLYWPFKDEFLLCMQIFLHVYMFTYTHSVDMLTRMTSWGEGGGADIEKSEILAARLHVRLRNNLQSLILDGFQAVFGTASGYYPGD